jgi:hypothetical protein
MSLGQELARYLAGCCVYFGIGCFVVCGIYDGLRKMGVLRRGR